MKIYVFHVKLVLLPAQCHTLEVKTLCGVSLKLPLEFLIWSLVRRLFVVNVHSHLMN
jgi:hypothetical protein